MKYFYSVENSGKTLVIILVAIIAVLGLSNLYFILRDKPNADNDVILVGSENTESYNVGSKRIDESSLSLTDQFNRAIVGRNIESIQTYFDICADEKTALEPECKSRVFVPVIDKLGWSPIMYAAYAGDKQIFDTLYAYFNGYRKNYIENSAGQRFDHLEYESPDGDSAPLIAAYKGWGHILKKFESIDLIVQNKDNVSVMDVLRETGNQALATQLSPKAKKAWKEVQTKLRDLGLYTGAIDGVAGRNTFSALIEALDTYDIELSSSNALLSKKTWADLAAVNQEFFYIVGSKGRISGEKYVYRKMHWGTRLGWENADQAARNICDQEASFGKCETLVITEDDCARAVGLESEDIITGADATSITKKMIKRELESEWRNSEIASYKKVGFEKKFESYSKPVYCKWTK